jgi:hypothetical protein
LRLVCSSTFYFIRLSEAKDRFIAMRGKEKTADLLAALKDEWQRLRALRVAALARTTGIVPVRTVSSAASDTALEVDADVEAAAGDVLCEVRLAVDGVRSHNAISSCSAAAAAMDGDDDGRGRGRGCLHVDGLAGAAKDTQRSAAAHGGNCGADLPSSKSGNETEARLAASKGSACFSSILKGVNDSRRGRVSFAAQLELGQTIRYN